MPIRIETAFELNLVTGRLLFFPSTLPCPVRSPCLQPPGHSQCFACLPACPAACLVRTLACCLAGLLGCLAAWLPGLLPSSLPGLLCSCLPAGWPAGCLTLALAGMACFLASCACVQVLDTARRPGAAMHAHAIRINENFQIACCAGKGRGAKRRFFVYSDSQRLPQAQIYFLLQNAHCS